MARFSTGVWSRGMTSVLHTLKCLLKVAGSIPATSTVFFFNLFTFLATFPFLSFAGGIWLHFDTYKVIVSSNVFIHLFFEAVFKKQV